MAIPTEDSFDASGGPTVHFNVLTVGHSQARKASYSVRHVPHANENIVQVGGRQHAERHFTLYIPNEGELLALDGCLGLTGTLSYSKGSPTAVLVEYDARDWFADDQQIVDAVFITDAD